MMICCVKFSQSVTGASPTSVLHLIPRAQCSFFHGFICTSAHAADVEEIHLMCKDRKVSLVLFCRFSFIATREKKPNCLYQICLVLRGFGDQGCKQKCLRFFTEKVKSSLFLFCPFPAVISHAGQD